MIEHDEMRREALRLAHGISDGVVETIARADAYLAFLSGGGVAPDAQESLNPYQLVSVLTGAIRHSDAKMACETVRGIKPAAFSFTDGHASASGSGLDQSRQLAAQKHPSGWLTRIVRSLRGIPRGGVL